MTKTQWEDDETKEQVQDLNSMDDIKTILRWQFTTILRLSTGGKVAKYLIEAWSYEVGNLELV